MRKGVHVNFVKFHRMIRIGSSHGILVQLVATQAEWEAEQRETLENRRNRLLQTSKQVREEIWEENKKKTSGKSESDLEFEKVKDEVDEVKDEVDEVKDEVDEIVEKIHEETGRQRRRRLLERVKRRLSWREVYHLVLVTVLGLLLVLTAATLCTGLARLTREEPLLGRGDQSSLARYSATSSTEINNK